MPDVGAKKISDRSASEARRCRGFDRLDSKTNLQAGATKEGARPGPL